MCPRRYIGEGGKSVLVGLTLEETHEFERLDGVSPLGSDAPSSDRLLLLYVKHRFAYDQMMSAIRE